MNLHFLVLTTLQSKGGSMNFTDLLNQLPIHTEGGKIYAILRELKRLGWISGDLFVGSTIRLTTSGCKFLLEQDLKQCEPSYDIKPEQKRNTTHNPFEKFLNVFKNFSVQILISVIAGILTTLGAILLGIG